jgi:hypothetical protein
MDHAPTIVLLGTSVIDEEIRRNPDSWESSIIGTLGRVDGISAVFGRWIPKLADR